MGAGEGGGVVFAANATLSPLIPVLLDTSANGAYPPEVLHARPGDVGRARCAHLTWLLNKLQLNLIVYLSSWHFNSDTL